MTYELPPIHQITTLTNPQQTEVLAHLFEPCPTLSTFLISKVLNKNKNYSSYIDMIEKCREELLQFVSISGSESESSRRAIDPAVSKIIAAHPRLGTSKPSNNEQLSVHSLSEQKSLQSGSEQEAQKLLELNNEYESTFPGLRYVVFVNGRPRTEIMKNMQQRIQRGDISKERTEAFNAMCDIALDRASKLTGKL